MPLEYLRIQKVSDEIEAADPWHNFTNIVIIIDFFIIIKYLHNGINGGISDANISNKIMLIWWDDVGGIMLESI